MDEGKNKDIKEKQKKCSQVIVTVGKPKDKGGGKKKAAIQMIHFCFWFSSVKMQLV